MGRINEYNALFIL